MIARSRVAEHPALPPLGPIASAGYAPIDDALHAMFLSVAVPTISAVLFQLGLHRRYFHGLRLLGTDKPRFCGAAWTVRAIAVREDIRAGISAREVPSLNRICLDAAPAGAVVALGSGGRADVSFMGDIMTASLIARGVAGVVLDTSVSDATAVAAMALPIACAGGTSISSFSRIMVVGCDEAIDIGDVAVFPGDVIVGDMDGAVCVPRHMAGDVARRCVEQEELEAFVLTKVRAGMPIDQAYPPDVHVLAEFHARAGRLDGAA